MKLKTFYKLFYRHRVIKANIFLKIYLILIIPFRYIANFLFFKKKINLDQYSKKKADLYERDLNYLFEYFNSDKGTKFYDQYVQPIKKNSKIKIDGHGYSKFYEDYFKIIKNKKLNILEIGSFYGNASAALYFYFQKANIFSADIFPDLFSYSSERVKNFYVDSSEEISVEKHIVKLNQSFDIIIEDASHSFKDQIISLFMLFDKLNPGGIFIVEELDFPDTRKDMNLKNERPTLRDILIDIQINKDFTSKFVDISQKDLFLSTFDKIEILKGKFNEFAIITKKK